MKILCLILILALAYFNFKDEISIGQIVYFLLGSAITYQGFTCQTLLSGIGLVLLGLFVMKPPIKRA